MVISENNKSVLFKIYALNISEDTGKDPTSIMQFKQAKHGMQSRKKQTGWEYQFKLQGAERYEFFNGINTYIMQVKLS